MTMQTVTGPSRPKSLGVIELSKLPLFPPAALKILGISTESDSAPEEFEGAFKSDPALAAELLLVVNSAAFGGRSRIDSIRHAVLFLGLEKVKALANTVAFCFYVRSVSRTEFARCVWSHSIATALAAERIAILHGRTNGYTAGLLHDLGRLVFLKSAGQEYAKEMMQTAGSLHQSLELERARFGMTHCEAGDEVVEHWGFPGTLHRCVARHHDPAEGTDGELQDIQLACRIATALGYPEVGLAGTPEYMFESLPVPPGLDREDLAFEIKNKIAVMNP